MSGSVLYMHQVVERDSFPLDIPARPMRVAGAASSGVQCREMPGRIYTFEVHADTGMVGYLRWDADGTWIARTRGGEAEPPAIRRFTDRAKAVAWLQQRLNGRRA